MEVDQRQFIASYLELISLSDEKVDLNEFPDYSNVQSLGPSLPSVKFPLPSSDIKGNKVKVSVKSIKPPHKFSTELNVKDSDTIFTVKLLLIDELKLAVKPTDIKLLLKGKVLQDSQALSTLDNLSFMCMISVEKSAKEPEIAEPEIVEPEIAEPQVSQEAWTKIYDILAEDTNPQYAANLVSKFKKTI